jgi:membrane protease subunit HflK
MQQVFANTTKIYVDSRNSTLLSLPLERLLQANGAEGGRGVASAPAPATAPAAPADAPAVPAPEANRARDGLRSRERDGSR